MNYPMENDRTRSIVLAIGSMNFEGNIIPTAWFDHLKYPPTPKGETRPHVNAILILSELVYLYRPVEVRDENTGRLVGYHKKFRDDKLQKSRGDLAKKFGFSKTQVDDALKVLRAEGLITTETRDFNVRGMKMKNVLYIEVNPKRLKEITMPVYNDMANDAPRAPLGGEVSSTDDTYPVVDDSYPSVDETNTKNTTKITLTTCGAQAPLISPENQKPQRPYSTAINPIPQGTSSVASQGYPSSVLPAANASLTQISLLPEMAQADGVPGGGAPKRQPRKRRGDEPKSPSTVLKERYADVINGLGFSTSYRDADMHLKTLTNMGVTPDELETAIRRRINTWRPGPNESRYWPLKLAVDAVKSYRGSRSPSARAVHLDNIGENGMPQGEAFVNPSHPAFAMFVAD
jgi:DNA-binding transcriptional ArsR family regulator